MYDGGSCTYDDVLSLRKIMPTEFCMYNGGSHAYGDVLYPYMPTERCMHDGGGRPYEATATRDLESRSKRERVGKANEISWVSRRQPYRWHDFINYHRLG